MKSKRLSGFIILGLLLLLVAASAPVCAQSNDSEYSFKGFYVGGNLGRGWGNADTGVFPLPSATQFVNLKRQTLRPDPSGFVGGGQVGYNWQHRNFVFGLEADMSFGSIDGTETLTPITQNDGTPFPGAGFISAHQDTSFLMTYRPRVGIALTPRFLIYGTGGFAVAHVNYSAVTDFRPVGTTHYPVKFDVNKVGYAAGAGAEFLVAKRWTVRGEYLFVDLGPESAHTDAIPLLPPFGVTYKFQTVMNVARGAVNYRF